ncbi:hypothetical protein VKT23_008185 [Stygiomarasmius scandens]|uniref:Gag protein n=1 Tax=Marasmiellus scandens TaxID=2682957 RepID=A0ABR1JJR8_9AGAR
MFTFGTTSSLKLEGQTHQIKLLPACFPRVEATLSPSATPVLQPPPPPPEDFAQTVPSPAPSPSPTPSHHSESDTEMTDNNLGSLVQQMAQHQRDMQEQMTRLIETLGQLKPDKTSTSKPDPFTGKANDVRCFLSLFKIWAASQSDLNTEEKNITSTLSFMQGEAADWAARHANLIVKSHEPNSMQPFPFDGKWAQFEKEFKTRFGSRIYAPWI